MNIENRQLPTVTSTDQLDALLPQNLDRERLTSS
jgi:hypothetical protein